MRGDVFRTASVLFPDRPICFERSDWQGKTESDVFTSAEKGGGTGGRTKTYDINN